MPTRERRAAKRAQSPAGQRNERRAAGGGGEQRQDAANEAEDGELRAYGRRFWARGGRRQSLGGCFACHSRRTTFLTCGKTYRWSRSANDRRRGKRNKPSERRRLKSAPPQHMRLQSALAAAQARAQRKARRAKNGKKRRARATLEIQHLAVPPAARIIRAFRAAASRSAARSCRFDSLPTRRGAPSLWRPTLDVDAKSSNANEFCCRAARLLSTTFLLTPETREK